MSIIQISELLSKNVVKISLVIQKEKKFSFDQFIGGYHAYIEIWLPKVGYDSLHLKCEDRCSCNDWGMHWCAFSRELE